MLQFAATWVLIDISYTVSQLASFCALVGTLQWEALHHLMEYLEGNLSFKKRYQLSEETLNLLSGYTLLCRF